MKTIGEENSFRSKSEAIVKVFNKLDPQVCRNCRLRVFNECGGVPGADTSPSSHTIPPETNSSRA